MPVYTNCGEVVSSSFARVFGNNENEVAGCVSCMSSRDLTSGDIATVD